MAKSAHLKINWFPVQIPEENLRIRGVLAKSREDYRQARHIRQYRYKEGWLATCVSPGDIPVEFSDREIGGLEIPMMTSTLISEAFLRHYEKQGFLVERLKGENAILHQQGIDGLPEGITFFEGLLTKPFYVNSGQQVAFGLVINFATRQKFTDSLADDPIQRELAKRGCEVQALLSDGSRNRGMLHETDGNEATIEWHGRHTRARLEDIRVEANYQTIKDYVNLSEQGNARAVIRRLMEHSLSLSENGFANVRRLTDEYSRVAKLLGRNQRANINITLPTECRSVISIATEPAELQLSAS